MNTHYTGKDFFKLTESLLNIQKALSEIFINEFDEQEIGMLNYKVVHVIYLLGGFAKKMSITEFKKKAAMEHDTVAYHVGLAHKKGYVSMELKNTDKRVTIISLTERGKKVYDSINFIVNDKIAKFIDIQTAYDQLQTIGKAIEKISFGESKHDN